MTIIILIITALIATILLIRFRLSIGRLISSKLWSFLGWLKNPPELKGVCNEATVVMGDTPEDLVKAWIY